MTESTTPSAADLDRQSPHAEGEESPGEAPGPHRRPDPLHPAEPEAQVTQYDDLWFRRRPIE